MKKIILIFITLSIITLTGCHTPQIVREDVSFAGLKTFYVEKSQNGEQIFEKFNNEDRVNNVIISEIISNLTKKGFINVAKKENAQIVFVPVWSVSVKDSAGFTDAPVPVPMQQHLHNDTIKTKFYATLEIQAFLKNDSHWGWRGFSPIETSDNNITTAMLKNQITWALEFFPPEKHPNPETPILKIFNSAKVTEAEQEQELLEQQKKNEERRQEIEKAKAQAIEQAKKEGKKLDEKSLKEIEQHQPETIQSLEKSFERALQKRRQNK